MREQIRRSSGGVLPACPEREAQTPVRRDEATVSRIASARQRSAGRRSLRGTAAATLPWKTGVIFLELLFPKYGIHAILPIMVIEMSNRAEMFLRARRRRSAGGVTRLTAPSRVSLRTFRFPEIGTNASHTSLKRYRCSTMNPPSAAVRRKRSRSWPERTPGGASRGKAALMAPEVRPKRGRRGEKFGSRSFWFLTLVTP